MQIIVTGPQGANLRTAPAFSNNVLQTLKKGTIVEADQMLEAWFHVAEIKGGAPGGFVHRSVAAPYDPPPPPKPLEAVPYKSQWESDANQRSADCGQTCVAMVAAFFGQDVAPNTLKVQSDIQGHTSASDLVKNFEGLGLKAHIETPPEGFPTKNSIALVWYSGFKREHVQDTAFKGLHWVVFLDYDAGTDEVIIHDPDWWQPCMSCGDRKRITKAEWLAAFVPSDTYNSRVVVVCDG